MGHGVLEKSFPWNEVLKTWENLDRGEYYSWIW